MLISKYADEDVNELRVLGTMTVHGITWLVGTLVDDRPLKELRAYPEQEYADRYGLICVSGSTMAEVLRMMRDEIDPR